MLWNFYTIARHNLSLHLFVIVMERDPHMFSCWGVAAALGLDEEPVVAPAMGS